MRSASTSSGAAGDPTPGLDDAELVRRIRSGDRAAFAGLVRRHGGALLRFARVFVRDEAVAEEVVQEVGITVTNQRVLLHRARTRVRQALEEHARGSR